MRMTRPCDKLDYERLNHYQRLGPMYEVTFRRDIPSHMRHQPMFHCSLREPCATSTNPNHVIPPPSPIQVANGLEYEFVLVLDSKFLHNKSYYLVDWLGYDPNDRMWEPYENLANASNLFK